MNRKINIIIIILALLFAASTLADNIVQTKRITALEDQVTSLNEQIIYCERELED